MHPSLYELIMEDGSRHSVEGAQLGTNLAMATRDQRVHSIDVFLEQVL